MSYIDEDELARKLAAIASITQDQRTKMEMLFRDPPKRSAMEIAQDGYDTWAAKPHNRKWVKRIEGTPIPNDLVVCIAMAFANEA